MKYETIADAVFVQRPNRFIAHCLLDGEPVVAHVKNTGRCRELLLPGAKLYLQDHRGEGKQRKTNFSLIAVEKGELLINMDSQAPNKVAEEGILSGNIALPLTEGEEIVAVRREVKYGDSRFDLQVTTNQKIWYVEVKGVTLEDTETGLRCARFPDAPTERGVKHIRELIAAKEAGHGAAVLFIIQMPQVDQFRPNWRTHAEFGFALQDAAKAGVAVLAYDCNVTPDTLEAVHPVAVNLDETERSTHFSTDCDEELLALLTDSDRAFLAAHHRGKASHQSWLTQALMRQAAQKLGYFHAEIGRSETGAPITDIPKLYVSGSHTEGCCAAAASLHPVGIDAEPIAPARYKVAQRMFSQQELAWMNAHADRDYAFTLLWTLKEAYGKLRGVGLSAAKEVEFYEKEGELLAGDPSLRIHSEVQKKCIITTIIRLSA